MMRLMRPAARTLARLAGSRRVAGDVVVLRDRFGECFALPVDALLADPDPGACATGVDRRTLEAVGASDETVTFRDGADRRFRVPVDLIAASRVPAHAAARLARQLEPARRAAWFECSFLGSLELAGTACISYVPDPRDGPLPPGVAAGAADPPQASDGLAKLRDDFSHRGWCAISGGAFGARLASLALEARGRAAAASHEFELTTPSNVTVHARRHAEKGPLLERILHDPAVVSTLRALSGVLLVPTMASYYFYGRDDHISLHRDVGHCPFALVAKVLADPPPLIAFPGLRECSQEELQRLVERGVEERQGEPMRFPEAGGIFFRGGELPHYRPARAAGSELVGVAQLCFRPVWNEIGVPSRLVSVRPVEPTSTR